MVSWRVHCQAVGQDIRFRFCLFCTLQTDDERNLHLQLFGSFDDTLRDVVAAHDTPKDVNEDALHFRIRVQDFERLLDSLWRSTSVKFLFGESYRDCQKVVRPTHPPTSRKLAG